MSCELNSHMQPCTIIYRVVLPHCENYFDYSEPNVKLCLANGIPSWVGNHVIVLEYYESSQQFPTRNEIFSKHIIPSHSYIKSSV